MRQDEVLAGLAEILAAVARVDPADVTPEKTFADDLGVDSLTLVEVVVAVEDRFGMLIPDDDWSRFRTVGDAIAYLERAAAITPV